MLSQNRRGSQIVTKKKNRLIETRRSKAGSTPNPAEYTAIAQRLETKKKSGGSRFVRVNDNFPGFVAFAFGFACAFVLCIARRRPNIFGVRFLFIAAAQVGRANAFKTRIQRYLDSTPVGLAFIARSSTKKDNEEEEVHKHCIGDVRG